MSTAPMVPTPGSNLHLERTHICLGNVSMILFQTTSRSRTQEVKEADCDETGRVLRRWSASVWRRTRRWPWWWPSWAAGGRAGWWAPGTVRSCPPRGGSAWTSGPATGTSCLPPASAFSQPLKEHKEYVIIFLSVFLHRAVSSCPLSTFLTLWFSLPLSFLLSLSPSLFLTLSLSPSLSLSYSLSSSLPLSLSPSLFLTLSPSLSFSLPLSFTLSLSLSPSLSFFLPLSFSSSLFLSLSHYKMFSFGHF